MYSLGSNIFPYSLSRRRQDKPRMDGERKRGRRRMAIAMAAFASIFCIIGGRLVFYGLSAPHVADTLVRPVGAARPDIIDRNGTILATDVRMASLYAEPRRIVDANEAVEKLANVLPELDYEQTYHKLRSGSGFVWLRRQLTPRQQQDVLALGIPGIGFRPEIKRFYPGGVQASHILGLTNIDNVGLSGMEKWIDDQGLVDLRGAGLGGSGAFQPVQLSIDARVQHVVHDELSRAMERYKATAAGGVILNVKTGEVMAMVSLPDYDPNNPFNAQEKDRLNRMSAGTAEMGSTIKTFTTAMALEIGGASISTMFDASAPIIVGRQRVRDAHGKGRPLSLEEVFLFSSNIGSAKEAMMVGVERHREFLERMGLLSRMTTELPEVARPVQPKIWKQATSITAAFGHGFATTPLQTAVGIAGILNRGKLVPATFVRRSEEQARALAQTVVSEETSRNMRYLYRLNGIKGSGRRANITGFRVGGKTGTAEKVIAGRYAKNHNFNVFAAAFPMNDPQFVVLVVVDDPRPERPGMGITAASNAAPVAGAIIERTAAMLGVRPDFTDDTQLTVNSLR